MDGIQEIVVLALRRLTANTETGKYGNGDDFDFDAFCEDVEDDVMGLAP